MKLFWNDINNFSYYLGDLYKENEYYVFYINEIGLSKALKKGCFGIGSINITNKINKSKQLFDFFKNRIISKNSPHIDEFLQNIGLKQYDEYEILKRTHLNLLTDNYFLED